MSEVGIDILLFLHLFDQSPVLVQKVIDSVFGEHAALEVAGEEDGFLVKTKPLNKYL